MLLALVASLLEGVTYGLFTAIYPRSGGEYVGLSRATHPLIGFVASFIMAFYQMYYVGVNAALAMTYGVAPLFAVLGLQLGNQGLQSIGAWINSPAGWFILGSLFIIIFAWQLSLGMKTYFKVQKWLIGLSLIGFVIFIIVLIMGSNGMFNFQANFDKYAGAGAYAQVIETAKADGFDLNPPFSWKYTLFFTIWPAFSFLFAVLSIAFTGEIKNVARGQLIAIPLAQLVSGVLLIAVGYFGRLAIGTQGLRAISYVALVLPDKFPFQSHWLTTLTTVMADNILLTLIICVSITLMTVYLIAVAAVYATRALLAWGIDGMAPYKLGEVSGRYHSPINAIIVTAVVAIFVLAAYSFTSLFTIISGLVPFGVVFVVTTFVAAIFPFIKRETYQTSPARIEIFGIPLITITGLLGSIMMAYMVYRGLIDPDFGANLPGSLILMITVFVAVIIWYFVVRAIRRKQGVDMDARFKEIPIE